MVLMALVVSGQNVDQETLHAVGMSRYVGAKLKFKLKKIKAEQNFLK